MSLCWERKPQQPIFNLSLCMTTSQTCCKAHAILHTTEKPSSSSRRKYQFWSPLFMTDVAKHSFSLTDHGSVGPMTRSLCSADVVEIGQNMIHDKASQSLYVLHDQLIAQAWYRVLFISWALLHFFKPPNCSPPCSSSLWTLITVRN